MCFLTAQDLLPPIQLKAHVIEQKGGVMTKPDVLQIDQRQVSLAHLMCKPLSILAVNSANRDNNVSSNYAVIRALISRSVGKAETGSS